GTGFGGGWGWGWLRTISSRWGAILRGRAPNPASATRLATREWTCAKSLPKPFYVACYVAEPISESSFLRRKVARAGVAGRNEVPVKSLGKIIRSVQAFGRGLSGLSG